MDIIKKTQEEFSQTQQGGCTYGLTHNDFNSFHKAYASSRQSKFQLEGGKVGMKSNNELGRCWHLIAAER